MSIANFNFTYLILLLEKLHKEEKMTKDSNNLFDFDSKFYKQISGTAIGTKFVHPYVCIFMDHIEAEFLKTQDIKPLFWKRFIDDIFFIWAKCAENLEKLLESLNKFHPNLS